MRTATVLLAAASVMMVGCDDDNGETDAGLRDSGMVTPDSGPPDEDSGVPDEDSGMPDEDAGVPDEDAGVPDEDAGVPDEDAAVPEAAPEITRVEWEAVAGCSTGARSDVTIRTIVTDADTPAGDLTFSGMATGCTGTIDAATTTVSCPNAAPYPSTVTVTDPEGNSDTVTFTFGICDTGSADF